MGADEVAALFAPLVVGGEVSARWWTFARVDRQMSAPSEHLFALLVAFGQLVAAVPGGPLVPFDREKRRTLKPHETYDVPVAAAGLVNRLSPVSANDAEAALLTTLTICPAYGGFHGPWGLDHACRVMDQLLQALGSEARWWSTIIEEDVTGNFSSCCTAQTFDRVVIGQGNQCALAVLRVAED